MKASRKSDMIKMKARKLGLLRSVVLVTLFVVALPVFPVFLVYYGCRDWHSRKRLRKLLSTYRCRNCDSVLGVAALRQADNEWRTYLSSLKTKYPSVPQSTLHASRWLDAVCKKCGARYTYQAAEQSFVTIEDRHDIPFVETESCHDGD